MVKKQNSSHQGNEDGGSALIDVRAVGTMLGCSVRHVYRLTCNGKMPTPVRLGALVRWDRSVLDRWIAEGCPAVIGTKGGERE